MSQAGWYPDPGGQPGAYRYWDGRVWSAATTTNPQSAPPAGALGAPPAQSSAGSFGGSYGSSSGASQQPGAPAYGQTTPKRRVGWWVVAGVVALVVLVGAVFGIRALVNQSGLISAPDPNGTSSREICPQQPAGNTPAPQPSDGRVHGGQLSYPMLGSPFGAPEGKEFRVPFGSGILVQSYTVEPNYDQKGNSWVASVLIGELVAGDGFFSPQEGSEIVTKCILGTFYGDDTQVNRADTKNQAMSVDGKDGWIIESHLTFDIPNLKTKGETLIVVIVATSESSSSLFYASIPDTTPQLLAPAQNAVKNLKVDG